jgi:RNA polymerase sigma-70 factor (ECF subfamily)
MNEEEPLDPDEMNGLVTAAKDHDADALGELCEHFYPKVYRFMLSRVRRTEDAEDMASEVCVRVVESLEKQNGSFAAWVFRIARNLVTDNYRRAAVRKEVALSDELIETRAGSEGLEDLPILPHQLEPALDGLTTDQREVVHLRFVEGLSAVEIGEIQGRSAGAVRGIQFRALENLRDSLLVPVGGSHEQRN